MPEMRPGAIISRAFQIYRDQAGTLLGAALIIFGIQFLLALLLPRLPFIAGLAAFILSVFYGGMVVNLVRDVQDGRRDHSTGELFRSVTPVLPLLGLAIIAGIGIAIGFVLLIIPRLILLTIWAVAAPVMVIEQPVDLLLDHRRWRHRASHGVGPRSSSCRDLREPTPSP
jgi:hypothetical protein